MHAAVRLDHALLALDSEHDVHALLELAAPAPVAGAVRAPFSLALVLDRSGSMAGAKLETAKRCAAWLVGRLAPEDELAVIAYDDEVSLVHPLGPVGGPGLAQALAGIGPGGQTNLSGGWLKALEALRAAPAERPRKILLLSDGLANVGITDPGSLVGLAGNAAQAGIGTATLGFGEDFDEDLMTALADAGGGNAHFAPTPDAAPGIFAAELDGLTQLAAQNVSVEIRPAPAVEVVSVLNDFPSVAVPGGVQVALGDAYAGETRRVCLALHVPHLAALGPVTIAELVLRYVSVGDEIAEHTLTVPVAANVVSAEEARAAAADDEVREEVLVLKAARARDEAVRLADEGRHAEARKVLGDAALELRASAPSLPASIAEALDAEVNELGEAQASLAAEAYDALSRKRLHYRSHDAKRGRGRGPKAA